MIQKPLEGEILNFKLRGDAKLRRLTAFEIGIDQLNTQTKEGWIYLEVDKPNGTQDRYFIPTASLDFIVGFPDKNGIPKPDQSF